MQNILLDERRHCTILQIDRPGALNALSLELMTSLKTALETRIKKGSTSVLVLTGSGDKAFVAGADLREMQGMTPAQASSFCRLGQRVSHLLRTAPFITLAAVNGFALGGGLELALGCDLIYAARRARFGLPEVGLGLIPGFGGTQRLQRVVGPSLAKEWIFTGKMVSAEEAYAAGLVNRVCDDEALLSDCEAFAGTVAKNSFRAIMKAKRAIDEGADLTLDEGLRLEESLFSSCFGDRDSAEGIAAFLDKRKPHFSESPHA